MVASVQLTNVAALDALAIPLPPPTPSKAAIANFENSLGKPESAVAPAQNPSPNRTASAAEKTDGMSGRLLEMGTRLNDDYRRAHVDNLQALIDHGDPGDPYFAILNAEFAIGVAQSTFQMTVVTGLADSSKQALNNLLKNQG
jgi:hypothetical protein